MSLLLPEMPLKEASGSNPEPADTDGLEPVDVARHWISKEKRRGLVLLDSALHENGGRTLLALEPSGLIKGSLWKDGGQGVREAWNEGRHKGEKGGLLGWVGFDGRYVFGKYEKVWAYDHANKRWLNGAPKLRERLDDSAPEEEVQLNFQPLMGKQDFCARVERVLEYIAAGDIYQVNLSYPWEASWSQGRSAWRFYERLRRVSPAPYGAFMDLDGLQVCGASPECFLRMDDRRVITRPIKGTRPRGADALTDEWQARELLGSAKERAELVMITDLLRNDLGQVCEFGSVKVTGLCELERYAQVQHLVSTVEGRLRPEVDHIEALKQCFPGGSISGAPKKRALEIIAELEPFERGIYTGAMGYFGFDGSSQFNIIIRTAWAEGDRMRFYTGAGIVADSVPEKEWEETCHKAAGLLKAAQCGA